MKKSLIATAVLTVALTGGGFVGVAVDAQTGSHPSGVHSRDIAKAKTLTISMFAFNPATLKVNPGQKVRVVNMDAYEHTVTSVDHTSFNLRVPPNSTGTFTAPSTPGQYPFYCRIHRQMKGLLIVK